MTFREKNAWIAVVTTLAVWGYYFSVLLGAVAARTLDGDALFWLFVWCMGITILVMFPLNVAAAIAARQKFDAPPDERERLIDARANRIGLGVLETLALAVAALSSVASGLAREDFPADPAGGTAILMANGILFALVFSAVVREVVQIVHFRMMD